MPEVLKDKDKYGSVVFCLTAIILMLIGNIFALEKFLPGILACSILVYLLLHAALTGRPKYAAWVLSCFMFGYPVFLNAVSWLNAKYFRITSNNESVLAICLALGSAMIACAPILFKAEATAAQIQARRSPRQSIQA